MAREKQKKLTVPVQEPEPDELDFTAALYRDEGNLEGEVTKRELKFPHLHFIKRGKPNNEHMLIIYKEYSNFYGYLLARKNMKKYEYAGEAVKIFSDLDFGVTAIASGGDHEIEPWATALLHRASLRSEHG